MQRLSLQSWPIVVLLAAPQQVVWPLLEEQESLQLLKDHGIWCCLMISVDVEGCLAEL